MRIFTLTISIISKSLENLFRTLPIGLVSKNLNKIKRNDADTRVFTVRTLRVRAFFHKTVRVCHVYCNFKIGFTCRITVIFGTLKDGSLLINTLASNIFLATETYSKMASTLCQKQLTPFCQKAQTFIQFGLSDNVQILLACGTNTY